MGIASLTTALCLPALEIEALLQGRMMVATSHTFRNPPQFVLCPIASHSPSTQLRHRYRPSFLRSIKPSAKEVIGETTQNTITLYAWAKFDVCRIYTESHDLETLSQLTIWTKEYLQELIDIQHKIFLMTLQVYRFERPVPMMMERPNADRAGCYSRLPYAPTHHSGEPIISADTFERRKQQLFHLTPPTHPELEALQAELVQLRESGLGAMSLDRDLRYLLGWSRTDQTLLYDSDLAWIKQLTKSGQATDSHGFNLLVRQSLSKLGFQQANELGQQHPAIASALTNTTDGLGIYCDSPYPLIGHCQASSTVCISHQLTQQLLTLGERSLQPADFTQAIKIIFTSAPLTDQTQQAAIDHHINVMRPETLQRLAELQAQHPGCIDLYKLKPCLCKAAQSP